VLSIGTASFFGVVRIAIESNPKKKKAMPIPNTKRLKKKKKPPKRTTDTKRKLMEKKPSKWYWQRMPSTKKTNKCVGTKSNNFFIAYKRYKKITVEFLANQKCCYFLRSSRTSQFHLKDIILRNHFFSNGRLQNFFQFDFQTFGLKSVLNKFCDHFPI
jgi:hypothetical protein